MYRLIIALAFLISPMALVAQPAGCYGSSSNYTCSDSSSGNTYDVQKYGNSTYMQGRNAGNGSNWSQTTSTYGNSTYHSGRSADGNSWNINETRSGNTTYYSGYDSSGNSVNCSVGKYHNTCK